MKTFTAQVRVGERLYGNGIGRSKKEAEQQAAETAYGDIAAELDRRPRRRTPWARAVERGAADEADSTRRADHVPELPEVEVVRARPRPATSSGAPSPPSRCCTRARYAGTSPRPGGLRRRADRPPDRGRPPARQVPLAAARQRRRPARPPRHERPAAGAAARRRADERHLRVRFGARGRRPTAASCGSSTSGCSAACRSPTGGAELPPEIAHIARDPLDPEFDDDAFVAAVRRRASGIKRPAARPDPDLRRRQHLRRRGAVARPAARRAAGRQAHRRAGARAARPRPRGDARGARRRAARRSTRSTSTSTASPATSTGRCTPTAGRASPATGAARRSGGWPS